jgi:hypothetical protein
LQAQAEKKGQNMAGPGVALGDDAGDSASEQGDDNDAQDKGNDFEDDEGYYDLIAARSNAKKQDKLDRATAYALAAETNGTVVTEEFIGEDGRRQISYAIEKNKGLTPRRAKQSTYFSTSMFIYIEGCLFLRGKKLIDVQIAIPVLRRSSSTRRRRRHSSRSAPCSMQGRRRRVERGTRVNLRVLRRGWLGVGSCSVGWRCEVWNIYICIYISIRDAYKARCACCMRFCDEGDVNGGLVDVCLPAGNPSVGMQVEGPIYTPIYRCSTSIHPSM